MLTKDTKTYDFTKFKTISSFGDAIKNDIITMVMANDEWNQSTNKIPEFTSNTKEKIYFQ